MLATILAVQAQEDTPGGSLDGHGVTVAPGQGTLSDPAWGWAPWSAPKGTLKAVGVLEYAAAPLQITVFEGEADPVQSALLDHLLLLDAGLTYGVLDRVGVSLSAPIYLRSTVDGEAAGPGLGELRLWVPIGLVLPQDGLGFGASLVPWFDGPSPQAAVFRGSGGVGYGAMAVLGWQGERFGASANIGLDRSPGEIADVNGTVLLDSTNQLFTQAALSYRITDTLAVRAEAYAAPTFGDEVLAVVDNSGDAPASSFETLSVPAEASLGVRVGLPRGLALDVSGAAAASGAPLTSLFRAYAGLSWSRRPTHEVVPEPVVEPDLGPAGPTDLVVEVDDPNGRPMRGSVGLDGEALKPLDADGRAILRLGVGSWRVAIEADGYGRQVREVVIEEGRATPTEIGVVLQKDVGDGVLEIALTDAADRPVDDATLRIDGRSVGEVGNTGVVRVEGLKAGEASLALQAEHFEGIEAVAVNTDGSRQQVVMDRLPGSVRIAVRGPKGPVADALVRLLGPENLAPVKLDAEGHQIVHLSPGLWTVVASSAELGLQQRDVLIPEDFTGLIEVEVVLTAAAGESSLALRVIDPDGVPVDGAEVLLGGALLGTTSSGGTLRAEGLPEGKLSLEVRGARFRSREVVDVELGQELRELLVTLDWLPGSVRVIVRQDEGAVEGAKVRFNGPESLPPAPLGADGEGFFSLAPGNWTVSISAPSLGLQEREVVVRPEETSLLEIRAVLIEDEGGDSQLTVRVLDPDRKPVPEAEVILDGKSAGGTSTGGSLTLTGLSAGSRELTLRGPQVQELKQKVEVKPGTNTVEVVLPWKPGSVRLRAKADSGSILDALVRLVGPAQMPPTRLGADGERVFTLAPGAWTVMVSSESFGLQERDVKVAPGQETLVELNFELSPDAAHPLVDELALRLVNILVKTNGEKPVVADLRFLGPERVNAGRTDAQGMASARLRPAPWEVIAAATEYGARRESFVLEPGDDAYTLTIVVQDTQVEVTAKEVKIAEQVHFETDSSIIKKDSFALLDEVANTLVVNPQIKLVEIQGHTDNVGNPQYNLELSQARADAVRDYLIQKGVSKSRLESKGYGDTKPVADNKTDAGKAANRRVQFEIEQQTAVEKPVPPQ